MLLIFLSDVCLDCYNLERNLYKLYNTVVRDKKYARNVQVDAQSRFLIVILGNFKCSMIYHSVGLPTLSVLAEHCPLLVHAVIIKLTRETTGKEWRGRDERVKDWAGRDWRVGI
jgi:hypothetical protein